MQNNLLKPVKFQWFQGSRSSKNDQENYKKSLKKQPRKSNEKNMKNHLKTELKWSQKPLKIHSKINVFSRTLQKRLFAPPGPLPDAQRSPYWIFWLVFGAPLDFKVSPKSSKIGQVASKWPHKNSTAEILAPTCFQDPPWNAPGHHFGWFLVDF